MEKIVNEWRRLVDKESDIIFSRANVFLLTNGILVAGLLSGKDLGTITISVISLAGIILNLLWIGLGTYSRQRLWWLWEKSRQAESSLPDNEQIYRLISEDYPHWPRKCPRQTNVLCVWLPLGFIILWIILPLSIFKA